MTLEKDIKVLKLNLLIYATLMALSIICLIISRAYTFFYLNLLIHFKDVFVILRLYYQSE